MKYNLIQLDKTQIYSFKGCDDEHIKEVLKWLKENDKGWNNFTNTRFKESVEKYNLYYDDIYGWARTKKEPHTSLITDLFTEVAAEGDLHQQLEKEILQPMDTFDLMGYSILVDNEEQAKQLQDLAFKQGIFWCGEEKGYKLLNSKSFQFGVCGDRMITFNSSNKHYKGGGITKKAHFNDIFKPTLQQQLEKAKAEVSRLKAEINKPKVGDLCKFFNDNEKDFVIGFVKQIHECSSFKYETTFDCEFPNAIKITNPQLIKLLENESKN